MSWNNTGVDVWIGAGSPLLTYGAGWVQSEDGTSQCDGFSTYYVEIDAVYFTDVAFYWSTSTSYTVQAGIDGSLQSCESTSGIAALYSTFGTHSARLECAGEGSGGFELIGVKIQTEVVESGTGTNSTLDDASSQVTYTGFQSESSDQSTIDAITNGNFYENTISYTSTEDASASFEFQGSALYIFGMTGPLFGCFSVSIDSENIGTYNASTTVYTYSTLLFFTTYLDSSSTHQVTVTNLNDGMLLALDYFVAVQAGTASTTTSTGSGSTATANVGNGDGNTDSDDSGSNTGPAIIGGILGGLAALFLLWLWWAYRKWKKAGGEGSIWAAMCGQRKKKAAPPPKPEAKKWPLWPMILSKPKYDSN